MNQRHVALAFALLLIAASIYYLESMKARPSASIEHSLENGSGGSIESGNATAPAFFPSVRYSADAGMLAEKERKYPKAPEFTGLTGYVNTKAFKLSDLKGNVMLIDFWTYSCINCIRTQPYLNAWHEAYADDGLVIVGVHTPEFEFEKNAENVKNAMQEAGIKYAVVQDNNYATWRAYRNRYWPRKYLIDVDGFIRYDHIGEGAYEETESVIRELLAERSERFGMELDEAERSRPKNITEVGRVGTPEIYFGYKFSRGNFGSTEGFLPEQVNSYAAPTIIVPNKAYLTGEWLNKADYSELVSETGSVMLRYFAKNVNIVASSGNETKLTVLMDGMQITGEYSGGSGVVKEEKLYNIVAAPESGEHLMEIKAGKGFRIYTFTFG